MTNSYKLALLAALGVVSFTGKVQAQAYAGGDLLVGFYDPSSPNTVVVDLGSAATITGLTYDQWNLSTPLAAAGITPSSATTQYGVVGATQTTAYLTGNGSASWTASSILNAGTFITSMGQYITASTPNYNVQSIAGITKTGNDWFTQTVQTPPTELSATEFGNPNSFAGTSEILYQSNGSISGGRPPHIITPGSESTLLAFNFDPTTDTLTYGTAAVPEPSTYGLIAGAGLLALSLRNKLVRKQA